MPDPTQPHSCVAEQDLRSTPDLELDELAADVDTTTTGPVPGRIEDADEHRSSAAGPSWLVGPEVEPVQARSLRTIPVVEAPDLSRMFLEAETAISARRSGWPDLRESAAGGSNAERVEAVARASVPLRLAAHVINVTVTVIAWPIGAAMLLHGLAFGADLNTSVRVLALSTVGAGLLNLAGGSEAVMGLLF